MRVAKNSLSTILDLARLPSIVLDKLNEEQLIAPEIGFPVEKSLLELTDGFKIGFNKAKFEGFYHNHGEQLKTHYQNLYKIVKPFGCPAMFTTVDVKRNNINVKRNMIGLFHEQVIGILEKYLRKIASKMR